MVVPATVIDVQYHGAACRVRTELDDGTTFVADVSSDGLAGVGVGYIDPARLGTPRGVPGHSEQSLRRGTRMRKTHLVAGLTALALTVTACGDDSGGSGKALDKIGDGEKALNLVVWAGYAEDGTNYPEYDWVHPFEDQTGCVVKSDTAKTSDEMFQLMSQRWLRRRVGVGRLERPDDRRRTSSPRSTPRCSTTTPTSRRS